MTFAEMQEKLKQLSTRRAVLKHLTEYIDTEFMCSSGLTPKKTLLSDDRVAIPVSAFDEVVSDIVKEIGAIESDMKSILHSDVLAPMAAPKSKLLKKSKKSNVQPAAEPVPAQGESK